MAIGIALIRGINVGGNNPLPMDLLRTLCEDLGLRDPRTYIQSGNVVFRAAAKDLARAGPRLEDAIEGKCGFRPGVVVRASDELKDAVEANPFADRRGIDSSRLLVMFLAGKPTPAARRAAEAIKVTGGREELRVVGPQAYIHYPDGIGRLKLSMAAVERALKTPGTCRNWNTTMKLLQMAEEMAA